MPDTENGRVTLAVAVSEIKNLRAVVVAGFSDAKEERAEIKNSQDDQDKRIRDIENEQVRNQVQHKYLLWGQSIFTLALTGVRARFGPLIGLE